MKIKRQNQYEFPIEENTTNTRCENYNKIYNFIPEKIPLNKFTYLCFSIWRILSHEAYL